MFWINENEIAGNGIDDDGNGYVDDINGWNFEENSAKIFTANERNHCDFILYAFQDTLKTKIKKIRCEIMLLNILGVDGQCTGDKLIEAIEYARKNGAQICNLSLSTYTDYPKLKEIIETSDLLFVVAAGNEGEDLDKGFPSYPTNYKLDNVISVAATDENGKLLEESNYGENTVDILMNGVINYKNEIIKGTSIATARVTAIIVDAENNYFQNICELI